MPSLQRSAAAWEAWRKMGSPRYVTAPMVDASELAFRELCRRYGATLAYTPMLNAKIFASDPKYRAEHFTTTSSDRPLAAQFCANDPMLLVAAARHVQHAVDAIDLNLGCPQGIARKGNYGSFLQDEWDLLSEIVETAARELTVPIWCKIRIFPSQEHTIAYARMLEAAGASLLAVHGRTRDQKGRDAPPANWDTICAVKRAVSIPVIANGNVRCLADADDAIRETTADAVMSAWALLDNPATFYRGQAPFPSRLQLAREYLDLAEKYNTPMRMVRLHIFKLFRSRLDVNMDLNGNVASCRSIPDFREIASRLESRCDFDGVSFEDRCASGNVPTHVVSEKRAKRLEKAAAAALAIDSAAGETLSSA